MNLSDIAVGGDDKHLFSLRGYAGFEDSSDEQENGDTIEVVSELDEENDIVDMTKNLVFSSEEELQGNDADDHYSSFGDENNRGFARIPVDVNLSLFDNDCSASVVDASDDDSVEYSPLAVPVPSSSSHSSSITTNGDVPSDGDKVEKSVKRKRRQWSVEEKLDILTVFKLNKNKNRTAVQNQAIRISILHSLYLIYMVCMASYAEECWYSQSLS